MKVAFATENGLLVDQHFGWCRRFDIYQVSPQGFSLAESRLLEPAGEDENDKLESRLGSIRDCTLLYVASIGATGAARVVNAGIHPVKVKETEKVADVIKRLRDVLAGTPPPWLRKIMREEAQ